MTGLRGALTAMPRQSTPANRASNCTWFSIIGPDCAFGQTKRLPSRRFIVSTSPFAMGLEPVAPHGSSSQTIIFSLSARRDRNTQIAPSNGSSWNWLATCATSPSMPFLKSIGSVAR